MGWGSGAVELPYLINLAEALHAHFDDQMVEIMDWCENDNTHVESAAV